MMKLQRSRRAGWRHGSPGRQGGVSIVLVTLALFMLLAFTALSVDGGNLLVAKNELHNAADAGSLAGARFLYVKDGSWVNDGTRPFDPDDPGDPFKSAEARATEAAEANNSQNSSAEVLSAQRGHWSFADRTFTPNHYSLEPVDLFEESTEDLDLNPNFINAVEVVTARQQTQVEAFFGRVLGFEGYDVVARSVAYIGFAGTLRPEDVDQPIALCKQALQDPDGNFSCNLGRFIPDGDQTGGWTNFEHDQNGATNANELRDLVEGDGNENEMYFGEDIATNNGQVQSAFQAFYDRWVDETSRETTWTLTLPVIDCEDGVAPGNRLVGTVTVHIVWAVSNAQENKIDEFAPERMGLEADAEGVEWPGDWENASTDGETRWDDFVDHFSLRGEDDTPADWRKMSIYFLPSCDYHEPKGQTGGENFGILARIPVLVD
ncbi:TadG family pilus assembly protein [Halomonas kalidii]|uniref:TadG family pilus assembly protein n=1 Tax=Halomonas kalidii TaxID=3043293 RepID=A0ABT6VJ48_9GAMM|nr:TadG family pilus assembly protein [Halomonas kalidii]MDI5934004.1 TadG family pilus assembly protein [Halomonas kalidii]